MSQQNQLVYTRFERFWHWSQAALILFLAFTGFEIHDSFHFFGFEQAVRYHNAASIAFIVLIVFAMFWHFTTGQWKQYLPTRKNLKGQAMFYLVGMFRNAPHPSQKTALNKLNPLQRLIYLGLKILVIPVMVLTGLLYMFYRYPQRYGMEVLNIGGLETIALVHTFGAFCLLAFIIAHVYMTTTGKTATSNLEAMITGYEELDDGNSDENESNLPTINQPRELARKGAE